MKKIICRDLYNNKIEVDSSKLTFRPSVYGILIKDNKILLSKQWDGYDFPGGGIHLHETILEALKREFFEETGLKVHPIKLMHCETVFFHPGHIKKNKNKYLNCLVTYYLVKKIGGEISNKYLDEEEKKYVDLPEWIDFDQIEKLKFYNSIDSIQLIRKAIDF